MMTIVLSSVLSAVVCLGIYILVTKYVTKKTIKALREAARKEAEAEGEMIKKEKILQAKEKFIQLKSEHDRQVNERNQKIAQSEQRAKQIENNLQNQQRELEGKVKENARLKEQMEAQLQVLEHKKEEIDRLMHEQNTRLEQISGLSSEDAKSILIENMKAEAKADAAAYINETIEEAKMTATKEAKRIIVASIQRVATETAIENAVTVFNIESDEVKGRIIGREGRNIRALEAATGIEIIVDDTPEAIILSGFDPVRREIARLALHQLVTDGRIHPARIEEVVAKVQKQIEEEIVEVGKRTAIDLGIHGLHPELIRMIGKMKYRSSYGQNLLQHARETANLAGIMAAELGLNPKTARRAGLLHDIGKVPDDEPELPHAIIGMKLAEKYKEKPEVCNAIGAHHDEIEMSSLIAPIIQVCDAISGARPGARREVVESYIKRLKEMEDIALSYPGVVKTYTIQAGRELRVIVGAEKLSDMESESLSPTMEGTFFTKHMNKELQAYVEQAILPRYEHFDRAHGPEHARTVIEQSLALARHYQVDRQMVYAIAAYHDVGLEKGREMHHIHSGEILAADTKLRQWFSPQQIAVMREAVEDHRASSDHEPRTIYGRIVAEADRCIDPPTIVRRTIQYGLANYPELDREDQYRRCVDHLTHKYAEGGYLRLWIPESDNALRLARLRELIRNRQELRRLFDEIFDREMAANG